jgi:PhnB protein
MGTKKGAVAESPEKVLVLTRVFDAPRELVFKAWIDPKHVAQWWGPHGFTNPVCELDARPGGAIRIHMRGPDGTIYPMTGVFHEIVEPERIVFTTRALEDADGNPGLEVHETVTFTEEDCKTTITLRAVVVRATPAAAGALAGMEAGWSQSLERLARFVCPESRKGESMKLQPYLYFDGRTEEAIEFYRKALGAQEVMVIRFKDSPDQSMTPPGAGDKVMHASFRVGDTTLLASDGRCQGRSSFQGITLSLTVATDAEAERLFAALAEGGQVQMPLTKTFFSSRFGMVADRFGVSWMVHVGA